MGQTLKVTLPERLSVTNLTCRDDVLLKVTLPERLSVTNLTCRDDVLLKVTLPERLSVTNLTCRDDVLLKVTLPERLSVTKTIKLSVFISKIHNVARGIRLTLRINKTKCLF